MMCVLWLIRLASFLGFNWGSKDSYLSGCRTRAGMFAFATGAEQGLLTMILKFVTM